MRAECLEYALAHDERFGIWGGLSERERRKLKKRAALPHSLYEILQILSVTMFETTPINQLLADHSAQAAVDSEPFQLVLL